MNLIPPIRGRFIATNRPFVIENVRQAPLHATLMLCGSMFGLKVIRHRYFEMSPDSLFSPFTCNHTLKIARQGYAPLNDKEGWCITRSAARFEGAGESMGIDWMQRDALQIAEAIPPAYTEFIGKYLIKIVRDSWKKLEERSRGRCEICGGTCP